MWVPHCWRLCWLLLLLHILLQKEEECYKSRSGHQSPTRYDYHNSTDFYRINSFRRIQSCLYPGRQAVWTATAGLDSSPEAVFTTTNVRDRSSSTLPVQLMWSHCIIVKLRSSPKIKDLDLGYTLNLVYHPTTNQTCLRTKFRTPFRTTFRRVSMWYFAWEFEGDSKGDSEGTSNRTCNQAQVQIKSGSVYSSNLNL